MNCNGCFAAMTCLLKAAHMSYSAVQQVIPQRTAEASAAARWRFEPQSCFSVNVSSTQ